MDKDTMEEVLSYRGITICMDENKEFHIAYSYTGYPTLEEAKNRIDEILHEREVRKSLLDDNMTPCFKEGRGEGVMIDGEFFLINKIDNPDSEYFGKEYIYIRNPWAKDKITGFNGLIRDSIKAIRNGYGDAISVSNFLGVRCEHVIRFIDRKIGEEARQKSIQGFKNAEFVYTVTVNIINGGSYLLGPNCKIVSKWLGETPMYFDTEAYAEQAIQDIEHEIAEVKYTDEYIDKSLYSDDFDGVVFNCVRALNDKENIEKGIRGYQLRVTQAIKP